MKVPAIGFQSVPLEHDQSRIAQTVVPGEPLPIEQNPEVTESKGEHGQQRRHAANQ